MWEDVGVGMSRCLGEGGRRAAERWVSGRSRLIFVVRVGETGGSRLMAGGELAGAEGVLEGQYVGPYFRSYGACAHAPLASAPEGALLLLAIPLASRSSRLTSTQRPHHLLRTDALAHRQTLRPARMSLAHSRSYSHSHSQPPPISHTSPSLALPSIPKAPRLGTAYDPQIIPRRRSPARDPASDMAGRVRVPHALVCMVRVCMRVRARARGPSMGIFKRRVPRVIIRQGRIGDVVAYEPVPSRKRRCVGVNTAVGVRGSR